MHTVKRVTYENRTIRRVTERQVSIAVTGHMQDTNRVAIRDGKVLTALKRNIDSLSIACHPADPSRCFRIDTESDTMVRDPLVVTVCKQPVRVLNDFPVSISARQQRLRGYALKIAIAAMMVRIRVCVDGHG
jgi:hypothetical protein